MIIAFIILAFGAALMVAVFMTPFIIWMHRNHPILLSIPVTLISVIVFFDGVNHAFFVLNGEVWNLPTVNDFMNEAVVRRDVLGVITPPLIIASINNYVLYRVVKKQRAKRKQAFEEFVVD